MLSKVSGWLNTKARRQNLGEIKSAMGELGKDPEFRQEFAGLGFQERWLLARDLVNLQRGKYQEWRMWGIVLAAAAGAIWQLVRWWMG